MDALFSSGLVIFLALLLQAAIIGYVWFTRRTKENATAVATILLRIVSSIFILVFAFFVLAYTFASYILPEDAFYVRLTPLSALSDETLLGVLAILVSFGAFLAYVFKTVVQKDIHDELYRAMNQERTASLVESQAMVAYMHWTHYEKDREERELDRSIAEAEVAMWRLKKLDEEKYLDVHVHVKNAYGYYLAEKQRLRSKHGEPIDAKRRELALSIKTMLWQLIWDGTLKELIPYRSLINYEDTCAWIAFCFAENTEEKKEAQNMARAVIKGMEEEGASERTLQAARKRFDIIN